MPRRKPGHKYSAAERRHILTVAQKKGLTGAQVHKRFGVSVLTFYRWRGPVRGRRARGAGKAAGLDQIRDAVRAQVQRILPAVIQEQVRAYLAEILAKPGGRRRSRRGRRRR